MEYIDIFKYLKSIESYDNDEIVIDDETVFRNFDFESKFGSILPGGSENSVITDDLPDFIYEHEPDVIQEMLNKNDYEIAENIHFRYHIMMPKGIERSNDILLLFHGFNEKYWAKYFPWAKYIVEKTGKTVVFFPIAFHMNRAPALWSSSRDMYKVSEQRKQRHPDIICSTFSNVAISTRLHNNPKRLIWSGLQTYYDVIEFIKSIKNDQHPVISPDAKIDIFSYSIGSFLAEILMLTNESGFFSDTRFVSFCGGAAFNRMSPVSKAILDSEADVSIYSHIIEHLESHLKRDETLRHYIGGTYAVGMNFRSMLNYNVSINHREERFREMSNRIYAIVLKGDAVMPPHEVLNILNGIYRDIPIKVDIFDFPYKYTHEEPFPILEKNKEEVTIHFKKIFDLVCDFLI